MAERELPIRLWAPTAQTADAVVDGERRPMRKDGAEHWEIKLPVGTDYLLSIDGTDPRPDPRSAQQPFGIHGPSRVFDTADFAWSDGDWTGRKVLGEVIYELHVGTFTPDGTLDAAIEHLDHLVDLGIGTVELMPLTPFPGQRGWGYDGVSLFAVHEVYGGPRALQRFVDAAHSRGLAVCLDVVYNHFGPDGNYAPGFAPYFTAKHHTPWGDAINLDDEHCEGVRAFICDNAVRWLRDFHIDALRLDAVHALIDDSQPHILAELSQRVQELSAELGRELVLIAESDLNQASMVEPVSEGGMGMDGQWADDVHHALHSYLSEETFGYYVDFGPAATLAKAVEDVFIHDGSWSTFREQNWGAPVPKDMDRRKFVTFTQNHDQVGNRGRGDRPDAKLPAGALAGGQAILLLSPFTPLLFQGQEWGTQQPFQFFTDHDEVLGAAVSAGRLAEFSGHDWQAIYGPDAEIPDPQALSTFTDSKLVWQEVDDPAQARALEWHRHMIELRRDLLGNLSYPVAADYGDDWFRMRHGPVTVIICPGPRTVDLDEPRGEVVASWGEVHVAEGRVQMPGASVVILTDQRDNTVA